MVSDHLVPNAPRVNQSLRLVLEGKNPKLWDHYLDYACSALNSLKNRNTGYSANFLVFGRENNAPLSLIMEKGDINDVIEPNVIAVAFCLCTRVTMVCWSPQK